MTRIWQLVGIELRIGLLGLLELTFPPQVVPSLCGTEPALSVRQHNIQENSVHSASEVAVCFKIPILPSTLKYGA